MSRAGRAAGDQTLTVIHSPSIAAPKRGRAAFAGPDSTVPSAALENRAVAGAFEVRAVGRNLAAGMRANIGVGQHGGLIGAEQHHVRRRWPLPAAVVPTGSSDTLPTWYGRAAGGNLGRNRALAGAGGAAGCAARQGQGAGGAGGCCGGPEGVAAGQGRFNSHGSILSAGVRRWPNAPPASRRPCNGQLMPMSLATSASTVRSWRQAVARIRRPGGTASR